MSYKNMTIGGVKRVPPFRLYYVSGTLTAQREVMSVLSTLIEFAESDKRRRDRAFIRDREGEIVWESNSTR